MARVEDERCMEVKERLEATLGGETVNLLIESLSLDTPQRRRLENTLKRRGVKDRLSVSLENKQIGEDGTPIFIVDVEEAEFLIQRARVMSLARRAEEGRGIRVHRD